ncbi:unnamed protein product [Discosporangium mesarthrocarpum]
MSKYQFKCTELNLETPTNYFGRFVFRPLDLGQGVTIGNMLRRVLLTGLYGLRIVGIRIAGINNEFAIIEGVREDILEIILNLKEIILKTDIKEPCYGRLKVQGPAIVTASSLNLPIGIEIVNPYTHILTISDNSMVELEIKLEWGKSYTLAKEQKLEGPLDFIPIDSIFMPVHKANYFVEEITSDYEIYQEQVIIDIWTNGSIFPQKAIGQAANILMKWLKSIRKIKNLKCNFKKKKFIKTPIEKLNLSTRPYKILKNVKINFIEELVLWRISDIKNLKNFGPKSFDELMQKLKIEYKIIE